MSEFSPLRFSSGALEVIDQLALPNREVWLTCTTARDVGAAIRNMNVRGAPAIGIAAAYGFAIAAAQHADKPATEFAAAMEATKEALGETRPTAVNLFWALERMGALCSAQLASAAGSSQTSGALAQTQVAERLLEEAVAIHAEDIASCKRIGANGEPLIPEDATVLTHCNTGALATGGYGTALGVLRSAKAAGKSLAILADETRPYLQGARLTAWELAREDFDVTVIPDSAASFLIARGDVDCAIVGADRIAANGDTANKIGTYAVALACKQAGVPFYVAAPLSTVDLATDSGSQIPIEMRSGDEVLIVGGSSASGGTRIAPEGVKASYPAFDVTPAEFVTAIITEDGVVRAPYRETIAALFAART